VLLSAKRRFSTILIHLREKGFIARWMLLNVLLASVGVIGVYIPVPPAINFMLAVVSVWLLSAEVLRFRSEEKRISFVRRQIDDFADVKAALSAEDESVPIVVHGQTFLFDIKMSRLIGGRALCAELRPSPYVVPRDLAKFGGRYRRERLARESAIFNGPALGWASSVRGARVSNDPSTIEFVSGSFFDRLATDYFSAVDTRMDGSVSVIDGRRLFVDRRSRLRDFDDSWLFNGIGVSTIAITADGMFLLTGQSDRNVGERGLLAPSGSGSLEPKDFGNDLRPFIADLAIAGATRELQEEASVEPEDIEESHFLGFGRWLNKGGSPELFSVTFLKVDSHALRSRTQRREELVYVDGYSFVRPALDVQAWEEEHPLELVPETDRGRVSLPLGVNLSLLARAVHSPESALAAKLEGLFRQ
jgi:hypothetical protein